MQSQNTSTKESSAAVYLIQRKDRHCFKVGWAFNPVARAQALPEFHLAQLDLRHSLALWLPTRVRAQQVERALHKSLAPFQVAAAHGDDGYTEWFSGQAVSAAMRLLHHMPGETGPWARPTALRPLLPELAVSIPETHACSPQSRWVDIEDLWLRLSTWLPLQVELSGGTARLTFGTSAGGIPVEAMDLQRRAADPCTYRWDLGDTCGSFVRIVAEEQQRLVLTLASKDSIDRWPEADEFGWQVQGWLQRMQSLQAGGLVHPSVKPWTHSSTRTKGELRHVQPR